MATKTSISVVKPAETPTIIFLAPSPVIYRTATPVSLPGIIPTSIEEYQDMADYYGGLVVTLDHVGQTVVMKPGQGFLLRLGDDFTWTVSTEPADILTLNQKFTPASGEQGVFIARKKGISKLSALGVPVCVNRNPPCPRPAVLFELSLVIQ